MTEETLFALALEKPRGAERQAFLDAACGADVDLRARVVRLLAADERSCGILDQGAGVSTPVACEPDTRSADQPTHTPPDERAHGIAGQADPPGYELLGVVGEGG
ncbi:MAG TPA: hypothetical protein VM597_16595, partial [Gemmataceae bacterium]|nr:hypothetical protein [Gemmataceae bacterium]